ncbi:MAG: ribbon-helix-helix protein, CopG family [Candidatus Kerfeldbacteria bacterium]|nr:ribbon-helix-helix protein, CopG family [Candidatus Kerfeldbacteria bacterium]
MRSVITLSLPPTLKKQLDKIAGQYNTNRSQIAQQAIDEYLTRQQFEHLRQRLIPKAQRQGIFTDEDVFARVS